MTDTLFRVFLVVLLFVASMAGWRARRRGDAAGVTYWMLLWLGGMIVAVNLP